MLPTHLLEELQKYVDGGLIYIPKKGKRMGWGSVSGSKKSIQERNEEIIKLYREGQTVEELADSYFLSVETIRKIVYGKNDYNYSVPTDSQQKVG